MRERVHALLVYDQEDPLAELKSFLDGKGIQTTRSRNCAEAEMALCWQEPPRVIFTDTVLTDGTWAEVKTMAERRRPPVPVIVVSRLLNIALYLDVLERGASDFIVPPFREADLDYVVKGALLGAGRILSVSRPAAA